MSRRTSEANKAILAAWQKEQDLVRDGKGTRNWTQEQQQDILTRGKAYDENGRAFEGQHMKSVEKYPEFQGNPNNIQFLTKAEHLAAHQGNWQNPTNWYYDPITKQFLNFDEGTLIPCKIIKLTNPVITINSSLTDAEVDLLDKMKKEQISDTDQPISDSQQSAINTSSAPSNGSAHKIDKKVTVPKATNENTLKRFVNVAWKIAHNIGKFVLEHKEKIIGIAITAGTTIVAVVSSLNNNTSENSESVSENSDSGLDDNLGYSSSSDDEDYDSTDTSSSAERSTPREHEVPRHSQRYHTKDGVIIKEKEPYYRGGKK